MKGSSGRWVCGFLPLLSGCFPLLYAYPSLSFVPPIDAGPVPDKVYAFRVDITDERNGAEFPDHDRYVFREIPVSETARVPMQAKLDLDRGWVFYGPLTYYAHTRHTVVVRLYCPGFQTVEVSGSEDAKRVRWVEARGAREREKAVDELVTTWRTDASGREELASKSQAGNQSPVDASLFRCLAPGSVGEKHRRFLTFAADEYQGIAMRYCNAVENPLEAADYQRLMTKVDWLLHRARE
jgi:hypothetical protein